MKYCPQSWILVLNHSIAKRPPLQLESETLKVVQLSRTTKDYSPKKILVEYIVYYTRLSRDSGESWRTVPNIFLCSIFDANP